MPAPFSLPASGPASRRVAAMVFMLAMASCSSGETAQGDADQTDRAGLPADAASSTPSPDAARAIAALGSRCVDPGQVRPRGQTAEGGRMLAVQCAGSDWLVTLSDERNARIVDCELAAMQGHSCW